VLVELLAKDAFESGAHIDITDLRASHAERHGIE
jgi:hypothetical protein